ncbi:MAG TPA: putative sulfate exporter family transporter [Proteobacteria bacterium]|nr:putative sulfate exporter family transporter [Pseudomonadota bacterium]
MARGLFVLLLAACALPIVSPAAALAAGIVIGVLGANPWPRGTVHYTKPLLQLSVVGLGFGLSLGQIWVTGRHAALYTAIGITLTLLLGRALGGLFGAERNTTWLIAFGTAICGGSAIAAMAPVIRSKDEETAVALATVFTLNAAALLLFPPIGHLLGMDSQHFGLWAALAIHDTSSVVGAASAFGGGALAIATTVKLTRAVWIMPFAMGTAWLKKSEGKVKFPLFILGFVAAAGLRTALPGLERIWSGLFSVARQSLVVTLFLIGAGLSRAVLKRVGPKPFALGICLWLIVAGATLAAILYGWIG